MSATLEPHLGPNIRQFYIAYPRDCKYINTTFGPQSVGRSNELISGLTTEEDAAATTWCMLCCISTWYIQTLGPQMDVYNLSWIRLERSERCKILSRTSWLSKDQIANFLLKWVNVDLHQQQVLWHTCAADVMTAWPLRHIMFGWEH